MAKSNDVATTSDTPADPSQMTYAALVALFTDGGAVSITELDDRVKYEKDQLIGQPIVITNWRVNPEGNMGEFVFVEFTTPDDKHGFFTDGSTGVKEQLKQFEAKLGGVRPILVPKGLLASNYTYNDPFDGKDKPATTYYISNQS